MNKLNKVARLSAAASLLVLAACGGGGGGGPASNITSNPSGGTTTTPPDNSGGSTTGTTGSSGGSTFATLSSGSTDQNRFADFVTTKTTITPSGTPTLTAPVAATAGTKPTAQPNPNTQPLTANPSFPLTQTAIVITGCGIVPANTPVPGVNGPSPLDGGATLSVTGGFNSDPAASNNFVLTIPSLGISTPFTSSSLLKGASTTIAGGGGLRLTTSNSSYVALGLWEVDATGPNMPNSIYAGAFFTGYQTPTASMPTTGTASYGGTHNVSAIVTSVAGGTFSQASVLGDATFNADFGAGSVTGQFRNMNVFAVGTNSGGLLGGVPSSSSAPTPWNDVDVSGKISGNLFSGTATAGGANNGPTATITPGVTGPFNGGFYGPSANELGAAWSLKDSTHVVIGVATGKQ